jgi:hypothetical protein
MHVLTNRAFFQPFGEIGVCLRAAVELIKQFFYVFAFHFQNLPSCSANALKYVNICAMMAVAPINPDGSPAPLAICAYTNPNSSAHRSDQAPALTVRFVALRSAI